RRLRGGVYLYSASESPFVRTFFRDSGKEVRAPLFREGNLRGQGRQNACVLNETNRISTGSRYRALPGLAAHEDATPESDRPASLFGDGAPAGPYSERPGDSELYWTFSPVSRRIQTWVRNEPPY